MTENAWTTAQIGGRATKAVIAALMELDEDFFDCEGAKIQTDGALSICGMVNHADPKALKAFCESHQLTYRIHNDARPGVFDAQIDFWRPGDGGSNCDSNDHGQPVISLNELKRLVADQPATTLADIIAKLEYFEAVPPLIEVDA